jgi:Cd2+/Zn2+-exporting ATPase
MEKIRSVMEPENRQRNLTFAGGGLILTALGIGTILKMGLLRDGLMIAAAMVAGHDIAIRAWNALRARHVSIELLVTTAAAGALVIGEYWEAAAVTFLFVLGGALEARTMHRTRQVLGELLDLSPSTAIVLRDGAQEQVAFHQVRQGELVLIKPGAKIPVDGEVLEGRSAVVESAITGEPLPKEKYAGEMVYAGTINQNGLLKVRAQGVGADTTLARIIRRVERAQEEKAPTQRFIERFARWYTPAIIGLSVVVYIISRDIELALTLLVIGCPGALVISTPVSVIAGIGRSARGGILIKGGEYLESSGKITAIALDKTGTLTAGEPRLADVLSLVEARRPALQIAGGPLQVGTASTAAESWDSPWSEAQRDVLRWAIIAEAGSEHPLARAIMGVLEDEDRPGEVLFPGGIPEAQSFETITGKGVISEYGGARIAVGTQGFMQEMGISVSVQGTQHLSQLEMEGKTAVLVALDDRAIGILGITDPIRPEAGAMVRQLKDSGLARILMLTGDSRKTAAKIAQQAGLDEFRSGLLPEDKLKAIQELQREGHVVAMLGDGINDAPALATADIGIAMGAIGTDVAIETADIALMADDLLKIPEAIRLSKATLGNIRQNVIIALATVSALLLGVLAGKVHMAGGMLAHEASVLIVILNGMRLLRMK